MTVLYGKFEMPKEIELERKSASNTFGRFIAQPFERGFGHTIGNSLRRMLLSSLESPAVISVRIEGISHEFMSVEGIIEDMIHIVLNVKGALLRHMPSDQEKHLRASKMLTSRFEVTQDELDENNGNVSITLGRLIKEGDYEVVNPDLHLFTVTRPMSRQIDFRVVISRGYVPAENHRVEDKFIDEIVIDSTFSPVRLVNYFVESTRVGKDTDYDRLVFEVTTDGRVTPSEALSIASRIVVNHLEVFNEVQPLEVAYEEDESTESDDKEDIMSRLALKISDIEFSVRASNCLIGADIECIAELVIKPESELLKFRNFGKKSLNEIKAKLIEMNLHLGMDLAPYGITRENIRDAVQIYLEQKIGAKS
jgi:DNA-directed RNA polymerase subunit alpha